MEELKYSLGIDVDSKKLKCCMGSIDKKQVHKVLATSTFNNEVEGFKGLLVWTTKHRREKEIPIVITMEVTGVYHEQLAYFLNEKGYHVSVVLANRSKKYMQAIGYKSKTDRIDARGLSRMGAEQALSAWRPVNKYIYELRTALRHRENLTVILTTLRNQEHAQDYMQYTNAEVSKSQARLIKDIRAEIKLMDQKIKELAAKDKEFEDKISLIADSITGVGFLTVATIIAETNGFELFKNQSQLTSYAGYDVVENQSSTRVGKTKISKHGNSHIRRVLHMPALNVVRRETGDYKQVYERIFCRSYIKMKAYVAIQRKLLCLIFALWKKKEAFDPHYVHKTLQSKTKSPEAALVSA